MMKSYKHNGSGNRKWARVFLFVGIFLVVIAIAAFFGIRTVYYKSLEPVDPSATESIPFVITEGDTVAIIAQNLEVKELIKSEHTFTQYVKSNNLDQNFIVGTYSLKQSFSVQTIVEYLTEGKIETSLCTILPARRLDQIKKDFKQKCGFTDNEIEKAFKTSNYSGHPALASKPANASLEGYLFPDSYELTPTTKVETIITQSLDEMSNILPASASEKAKAQGLNLFEVVTLASIIEKEAGNSSDKPTIAQVFLRRIELGMSLESDVTALYGAIVDGVELPDQYTTAVNIAIGHDSPYNTRMHPGLPPGPISNVSKSSIDAVLNPADTDYLFFVAGDPNEDGTPGKTYFTHTIEEHNQAVKMYCKVLCN